jgi:hypothetical protein
MEAMVSREELKARYQEFFRFSKQEIVPLAVGVVIVAFIFSFRDWGETAFDHVVGLKNLVIMGVLAVISFGFRISCQKLWGLTEGYKSEFKVWWGGLGIMLIVGFISLGRAPIVLLGSMVPQMLTKHRLGEFRGGWSNWHIQMIAAWGVLGNLILAILFAVGAFALPESYFFQKGFSLNLIMAWTSLLPFPQLDGMAMIFGMRWLYYLMIFAVLLATILLVTGSKLGLILAIVIAVVVALGTLLTSSNK